MGEAREMLKSLLIFAGMALTDRLLHLFLPRIPGVSLAEPITILAVASAVSAATAATVGVMNYAASQRAAGAQKSLADQQAQQLKNEQATRDSDAAKAAVAGQSFGFGAGSTPTPAQATATGFGFSYGNQNNTGVGRSQLLGGQLNHGD